MYFDENLHFLWIFFFNIVFIDMIIILLSDIFGRGTFTNTSEILPDVHRELLKDPVDSVRFGLVPLAFIRASFQCVFIKSLLATLHVY